MKNLTKGIALISTLMLFSCTKVIYTHDQVLDMNQTKADVVKKFGIPKERKITDSTEQWLYHYQRNNSFTKHSINEAPNTQTINVTSFNRYKKYLIFAFDKKGNVIGNDSNGVDLTVKKKDTVGTIVLVTILSV